ncbi:MAG: DMT family transporter [Spirochaetales bacterium]|nr:DMT family transporter [Spirochaetales bacterium]
MTAYISIFITIVLFSSIETFSKMLTGNVDPFLIAFIRFFVSGVILLLIDIKKIKQVDKKDWKYLFFLGIVGISVALGSFHLAINGLSAATGAVIFSLNPIFSSLLAVFILKEAVHKNRVFGIIISFIGVYIVIFGFNKIDLTNIKSVLLMLVASIGFGLYIAASKPFTKKYGTFFTTGIIFIIGSLPYLLFVKSFQIKNSGTSIPVLLYLSLITTGLAYTLYFYGLKRVPIIVGTSMFYLKPILATIFAVFLLKESPPYYFYLGVIIILTGMIITMKKVSNK